MEALYRSLGYSGNPRIAENFAAYLEILSGAFRSISSYADPASLFSSIISEGRESAFLSVPDVAASVWRCSRGIDKESLSNLARLAKEFHASGEPTDSTIPWTRIRLTDEDANPYASYDAHPDNRRDGVGIGWWTVPKGDWFAIYAEAFRILRIADPGFFFEIDERLKKIVPLWTDANAHRSASYAEAFGAVYAGLVPTEPHPELSVLEALIHEWSHNKANLARNFAPLVSNGTAQEYYSSYRPDPRPIEGIFLWLHAFVPTVRVFLNAFDSGAVAPEKRIEKVFSMHEKNRSAAGVLAKHVKTTPEGARFLQETLAVHEENVKRMAAFESPFSEKFARVRIERASHSKRSELEYPHILR